MKLRRRRPLAGRISLQLAAVTAAGSCVAFVTLSLIQGSTSAAVGAVVVAVAVLASQLLLHARSGRLRAETDAAEALLAVSPAAVDRSRDQQGADVPPERAPGPEMSPDVEARRAGKLEALTRHVERLPDFYVVMKEHAKSVILDTEQASYALVDDLRQIDHGIKMLKDFVLESRQSFGNINEASEKSREGNLQAIDEINHSFERTSDLVQLIINERVAFAHVVGTMRRLHQEIRVVDGIAHRIKLLSLNASIEAARAAEYGAGFAVIAREIRALADQVRKATDVLGPLIDGACESVEQFSSETEVEGRLRAQLALLDTMQAHLGGVTRTLGQMLEHERALTQHTEEHSVVIEDAICRTLAALQFQDIVRQQLEGVIAALDDLHEATGRAVADDGESNGDAGSDDIDVLFHRLRDRYVMARQHTAHGKAVGSPATMTPDGGAAVELF